MTTHITPGALKVTITEEMTGMVDAQGTGRDIDTTNYFTVAAATVSRRLVTITATEVGLLGFAVDLATAPAATEALTYVAGHYPKADVRYVRITNKDDTNHVILVFRSAAKEFAVVLEHGQTFAFSCFQATGLAATMDANTTGVTPTLTDLDDITADAGGAWSCDLEVFVATV